MTKNLISKTENEAFYNTINNFINSILSRYNKNHKCDFLSIELNIRLNKELELLKKNKDAKKLLHLLDTCRELNLSFKVHTNYQYALLLYVLNINIDEPQPEEIKEPYIGPVDLWFSKEFQTLNYIENEKHVESNI